MKSVAKMTVESLRKIRASNDLVNNSYKNKKPRPFPPPLRRKPESNHLSIAFMVSIP